MGFVVSRYEQVQSFRPEPFWFIYLAISRDAGRNGEETEFKWRRGHLFEFHVALAIYEMVLEDPMARVSSVKKKPVKKWCVTPTLVGWCFTPFPGNHYP